MYTDRQWLHTPWLSGLIYLRKALTLSDTPVLDINSAVYKGQQVSKLGVRAKVGIYLYLLDLYSMSAFGQPVFCMRRKEAGTTLYNITSLVTKGYGGVVESIVSRLYGSKDGHHQVQCLTRWCDLNTLLLSGIWEGYGLKWCGPLESKERDVGRVRSTYLMNLNTLCGKGLVIENSPGKDNLLRGLLDM